MASPFPPDPVCVFPLSPSARRSGICGTPGGGGDLKHKSGILACSRLSRAPLAPAAGSSALAGWPALFVTRLVPRFRDLSGPWDPVDPARPRGGAPRRFGREVWEGGEKAVVCRGVRTVYLGDTKMFLPGGRETPPTVFPFAPSFALSPCHGEPAIISQPRPTRASSRRAAMARGEGALPLRSRGSHPARANVGLGLARQRAEATLGGPVPRRRAGGGFDGDGFGAVCRTLANQKGGRVGGGRESGGASHMYAGEGGLYVRLGAETVWDEMGAREDGNHLVFPHRRARDQDPPEMDWEGGPPIRVHLGINASVESSTKGRAGKKIRPRFWVLLPRPMRHAWSNRMMLPPFPKPSPKRRRYHLSQ